MPWRGYRTSGERSRGEVRFPEETTWTAGAALHAAVCMHAAAEAICSFDRDFDCIPELRRVDPAELLG